MKFRKQISNQKGFTLVEIAIVLMIIGLILGAVVKGGDLIQSAKQKKFYSNFIKQWELSILNYLDRTGGLLGDGAANGGTAGNPNGFFDGGNGINTAVEFTNIDTRLRQVGLVPPTITSAGSNRQYTIKGSISGTQTVSIELIERATIETSGNVQNNVLRFRNLPTDVAMALDGIVDGTVNGLTGQFRRDTNGTWGDATTQATVDAMYILDVP